MAKGSELYAMILGGFYGLPVRITQQKALSPSGIEEFGRWPRVKSLWSKV